jgi:hypothetical protein
MTFFFQWGDVIACGKVLSDPDIARCHTNLGRYFHYGRISVWWLVVVMSVLWLLHATQTMLFMYRVGNTFELLSSRGLTAENLGRMRWPDLLHFMETRVGVPPPHFVHRLMRKDNYIIALVKHELMSVRVCGRTIYPCNGLLHYSLNLTLMSDMVTSNGRTLQEWYFHNAKYFVNSMRTLAVVYLLLSPFIMVFVFYHSILQCIQNCNVAQNYFGSRMYTTAFQWKVRMYNEPMHMLQHRLGRSYMYAQDYMDITGRSWMGPIFQLVNFASGAMLTTLLLLAVLDEGMLERVQIGGRPLLLVATITTALFALTLQHTRIHTVNAMYKRGGGGGVTHTPSATPEACMQQVSAHTRYFAPSWDGLCHTRRVRSEFASVYSLTITHVIGHILDTLLCPYVILWHVIPRADAILKFVYTHSTPIQGVGYVCDMTNAQLTATPSMLPGMTRGVISPSALYMYESEDCL